jgi:hypothetical protein
MSDKRTTPDPAEEGTRRRKKAAPTIDLTATDVSKASPEAPLRDEHPSGDMSEPENRKSDGTKQHNWAAARQMLFAGFAGAAIVALAFLGFWLADFVPARHPAPADAASLAAFSERLTKIESAVAKPRPNDLGVSERLSAADNAMKALGIALAALTKRSDEATARAEAADKAVTELRDSVQSLARNSSAALSPADVDAVQKRLAALEQAVKSTPGDKPARLALSAGALRDSVVGGAPFAIELGEARSLGADEKQLAPLAPFATSGVPSAAALAQELRTLIPALAKASGARAPSGNFLDRLQDNASKLVRIRPVGAPAGDDSSSLVARIEVDAAHTDIDGALTDLGKLDGTAQALARDWIAKAQSRQTAIAAAHQFAVDATRALGRR